jgi:hypothetical protein
MVLARSRLGARATSSPATATDPESSGSRRLIRDSSVDFPAPLGPMMDVMPPRGMMQLTSSSTVWDP